LQKEQLLLVGRYYRLLIDGVTTGALRCSTAAAAAASQHAAYERLLDVGNINRDIDLFLSVI